MRGFGFAGFTILGIPYWGFTLWGFKLSVPHSRKPPNTPTASREHTWWILMAGLLCSLGTWTLFGTVPEAEQKYKVVSNGTWLRGTDQSGQPFADPAPYKVTRLGLGVGHWCRTV